MKIECILSTYLKLYKSDYFMVVNTATSNLTPLLDRKKHEKIHIFTKTYQNILTLNLSSE